MSSESLPRAPDPDSEDSSGRFRRAVTITLVVLALGFTGLTAGNAVRGPRLLGVDVNAQQAVERSGQRLVLRMDQAIETLPAGALAVSPEVPVQVSAERGSITVRFTELLRYSLTYTVTVPVRSRATGAQTELRYSFTTPDPEVYLLRRAAPGSPTENADEIVSTGLTGTDQVVEQATTIQEYAVAGNTLATITTGVDGEGTLTVKQLNGSGSTKTVARNAYLSQLQSASTAGMFGFVELPLDPGADRVAQLKIFDPATPDTPIGVLGFDGKPLEPQTWAFVPGSTSLIAQIDDATFYLIDPFNRRPASPLGAHLVLHGFVHNSTTAFFGDPDKFVTADLSTGKSTEIPLLDQAKDRTLTRVFPVAGKGNYVALEIDYSASQPIYRTVRISSDATGQGNKPTELYAPPITDVITTICLAPNGEYLAVSTAARDAQLDGSPNLPGYVGATSVFVDTVTGRATDPVAGFASSWCN